MAQVPFEVGGQPPVRRRIPVELVRCDPALDQQACGLVQMCQSVPPKVLYQSYWYRSGINQTMRDNLAGIAHMAEDIAKPKAGDLAIDIGCNDGTLLKSYQTPGLKILGIDPATNILEYARANGVPVINDFFSAARVRQAVPDQKPKIITSIAMFYDLENPHAFVGDLPRLERFERHYEAMAKPFEWKFTRADLAELMQRLGPHSQTGSALAA